MKGETYQMIFANSQNPIALILWVTPFPGWITCAAESLSPTARAFQSNTLALVTGCLKDSKQAVPFTVFVGMRRGQVLRKYSATVYALCYGTKGFWSSIDGTGNCKRRERVHSCRRKVTDKSYIAHGCWRNCWAVVAGNTISPSSAVGAKHVSRHTCSTTSSTAFQLASKSFRLVL